MSLKIRLARGGAKKRPYYYVVVAHSASPRDGRYIEQIGTFNPMLPKDSAERVKLDLDRCKHWLSVGAQPTDRVQRLFDGAGFSRVGAASTGQEVFVIAENAAGDWYYVRVDRTRNPFEGWVTANAISVRE